MGKRRSRAPRDFAVDTDDEADLLAEALAQS
jgi:hypothetical protein